MTALRQCRLLAVALIAAGLFAPRLVAQDTGSGQDQPPKTVEKTPPPKEEEPAKTKEKKPEKLNPAGYRHRVQAMVSVSESHGDLSKAEGNCRVTVQIHDPGGMTAPAEPVALPAFTVSGTGGDHTGESAYALIAEDTACHKENELNAWPERIECTFGKKTMVMTIDPNKVPGATQRVPKPPDAQWIEPEGKEVSVPASKLEQDTYTDGKGHKHNAPSRTGKRRTYGGAGSIEGGGGSKGSANLSVTVLMSGRACAADEPGALH
jgi:hypothetical protein